MKLNQLFRNLPSLIKIYKAVRSHKIGFHCELGQPLHVREDVKDKWRVRRCLDLFEILCLASMIVWDRKRQSEELCKNVKVEIIEKEKR